MADKLDAAPQFPDRYCGEVTNVPCGDILEELHHAMYSV
jgi:hypothetical protein